MPLRVRRHIRKMRGGAQSHLLECEDGNCYIVKFRNNPQHRRILVNELIASVLIEYLQIAAPPVALVEIDADFLENNPEVHLSLGGRRVPAEPGWHFGSRYPGDPERLAVYDFLPDALLGSVTNLNDFLAILVFDKWASNADGRQSIFFRARVQEFSAGGPPPPRVGFICLMIDHGFIFDGPNWDYVESAVQGLYPRRMVYGGVRSLDDFQPWLDQVVHFPEAVIDQAYRKIPPPWIESDEQELERVLERLMERRKRVPELIGAVRQARSNPFVNWK